jgi:hypothetical protein
MAASSSAWAQQQHARPDGVRAGQQGTWTFVNAPSHADAVNETSADTTGNSYIDSGLGNDSTIIFTLGDNVTNPGPGNYASSHIIRYYCQATVGTKPKGGEGCDADLYLNDTLIGGTTNGTATRGAFGLIEYTILDASALDGADYKNLEVRITSSSLDVDESIQVSWVEVEFPPSASTAPVGVTTDAATVSAVGAATVGGTVDSDGNDSLLDVGVYYSESPGITPPTEFLPFSITPIPTAFPGSFAGDLTGLSNGTTYYFKAYATNNLGETLATNERSFTTWNFPTLLATPTVDNVQAASATLGGRVTGDGLTAVTECGVVWSDAPTPDLSDVNDFSATALSCATETDFTVAAGGLTTGTTYYVRSYATNAVGTAYSDQEGSFIASGRPELDATVELATVTDTEALLGGNITDNGGSAVTAVGIYWDTIGTDPRNDGTHVPMTAAEPSFEELVTGLTPGATIYFLAYATNGAGTTDSTIINFPTQAGAPTMDPTPTVANIVGDGADLGGRIIADGGGANLDCGVEWTTVPGEPYESSQSFQSPPDNGTCVADVPFAVSVSGLTSGQTYYFRAWATSDAGSDVSNPVPFIPQAKPIVISTAPDLGFVTHNSALLGGNVTSDEGSAVTERGIVWDENPGPEGQPTKRTVPMGSGIGAFEQTVSFLPSGTTIHFEAYATNGSGTSFSDDNYFVTTNNEPTQPASNLVLTPYGQAIRATWTRGNGDGSLVAVWQEPTYSIDAPVDQTDYDADPNYSNTPPPPETSTNSGNFVVYKGSNNTILVTGLDLTTTYHFAVYEYAGDGADSYYIDTPETDFVTTTDLPQHNYDYQVDCEECHKHGTNRPRQNDLELKCKTCHDAGGLASTKREYANHLLPQRNPDIDYVDCGMCHELHKQSTINTTRSVSFVDSTERVNKSFLRANVGKYVDPNYNQDKFAWPRASLHAELTDQPKREEGNLNLEPVQAPDTPQRAVEGGNDETARGYCQVCHTLTAYHRSNESGGATTPAAHEKNGLMQCHDGGEDNLACATDVNCGDCHEHNNSFQGVNNDLPCEQCHDQPQPAGNPTRPIITTQFDTANVLSSHIPNGTPTKPDCVVCHGNHGHGGTVPGFDADDGVTSWGTSTIPTLTTGAGEVFEPHCLSCHDDASADSLLGSTDPDRTATSPFIGADPPPIVDETLWGDPAVDPVNAAAHNRPTSVYPTAPVTCLGNGANGCHASGHGSQSNSLLASWDGVSDPNLENPAGNAPVSSIDFCYNCHDADGPSSIDVKAQFNTATNYQATAISGMTSPRRIRPIRPVP